MSIIWGIGTVQTDIRYEFGVCGADADDFDKFGFCDTIEELGEVVDKFNQALQVYDDHCGQKYIMTLNHDMKKVETFKEGEKWLQMI
jgi:hypothetical protein